MRADRATGRPAARPTSTRGPHGRPTPTETRSRRRARPPRRLAGHPGGGRTEHRIRGPQQGSAAPARDLPGEHAPRARGDPAGRRHHPQRVLLRRVGGYPGVPPEGHRHGQQAAHPPGRPAGSQGGGRQRPDRGRRGRRAGQRDVRGHGRTGRGLSHPPGPPVDPARPAPRAGPAVRRPGARRVARRDRHGRLAGPGRPQHRGQARRRRAQGRDADAPSAVGHGAPPRPLRGGRRLRLGRGHRLRGDRGGDHDPGPDPRPGPAGRAPGRRARPLAHPPRRQRAGRGRCRVGRGRQRPGGRRRRLRPAGRPGPGPHAPAQAGLSPGDPAGGPPRDPAPGGRRGPGPHHRGRRAGPGRVRLRRGRRPGRHQLRSMPASRRSTMRARRSTRSSGRASTSSRTPPRRPWSCSPAPTRTWPRPRRPTSAPGSSIRSGPRSWPGSTGCTA